MDKFINETAHTELLKDVYMHMSDEESRKLYIQRAAFSLTDDRDYMRSGIRNMNVSQRLISKMTKLSQDNKNTKKIMFGAGTWGEAILENFKDIKWDYIIDNNRAGQVIHGYSISDISILNGLEDVYVVVAILFKYKEVVEQLIEYGIDPLQIYSLGEETEKIQYFDLPYLNWGEEEVFIDAGAYHGETSMRFAEITGGVYKKIIAFEPNRELNKRCRETFSTLENYELLEKGTWNEKATMSFICDGEGSRIVEREYDDYCVELVTIDSILAGKEATYIKMDVEGAEYNSLLGAKETICKYRPKLAISVYHTRDDIWKIPMLLLKYNPEYRFYLRMYSFTGNDTVLYAI